MSASLVIADDKVAVRWSAADFYNAAESTAAEVDDWSTEVQWTCDELAADDDHDQHQHR